ncbi:DTW domain-containing protein [Aestuariibacter halophilus]|uniref:tRNA-uridine aminocarboxypropyltransferase n=2 Tax=Fluctibacter halophilus TaxID=226011 RepID=A0ABS8GAV9_9ALTE|nr:DTW domain-containing protein [Aestuariibacter halophilus]
MNKRAYCPHCEYPLSTCLCSYLCEIASPVHWWILQHPTETKHAKNTARLVSLCMSNSQCLRGETEDDFDVLKQISDRPDRHVVVLYPNADSVALEQVPTAQRRSVTDVVVLDATWRKAYKLWQLNPWLHALPSWHFANPPDSSYRIRHTRQPNGLSTLEAVAYTLTAGWGMSADGLYNVFDQLQQHHRQPPSHQC